MFQKFCGSRKKKESAIDQICSRVVLFEETIGLATKIVGICTRKWKPQKFTGPAKKIANAYIRSLLHGNSKVSQYAISYQLMEAI